MLIEASQPRTARVAARLSVLGRGRRGAAGRFAWSETPNTERLAMPRSLVSLGAHPIYDVLSDQARWSLHLGEMANFFFLNIVGEGRLVSGLRALRRAGLPSSLEAYVRHFEEEELEHSDVFRTFCQRYGSPSEVARSFRFPRDYAVGEEVFTFFAQALVFEEVADYFNKRIAADDELWPLTRAINAYHAEDEARHLAFGRQVVVDLWEQYEARWSEEVHREVRGALWRYARATLRSVIEPSLYTTIGAAGSAAAALELRDEVLTSHWFADLERSALRRLRRAMRGVAAFAAFAALEEKA